MSDAHEHDLDAVAGRWRRRHPREARKDDWLRFAIALGQAWHALRGYRPFRALLRLGRGGRRA